MNIFRKQWAVLGAGNKKTGFNAMTISWGQLGAIWNGSGKTLPTVVVYARPQRYTKEFIDREEYFTVSFFDEKYKKALGYMGSHSGRNEEKSKNANLTEIDIDGFGSFDEAEMVLICKKVYHSPLLEDGFLDKGIVEKNYPEKDFHEMYVGEIIKVLVK